MEFDLTKRTKRMKGLMISTEMFLILKWLLAHKKEALAKLIKEALHENFNNQQLSSIFLAEPNLLSFTKILRDLIEVFETEIDTFFINSQQYFKEKDFPLNSKKISNFFSEKPQSKKLSKKDILRNWNPSKDDGFA